MIGTVLKHRYQVVEKIGEGNLFTVYRCEDKIDDRTVAVKVLLPQYATNRLFAERILVEAQAMVGVSHPAIVEVYDCGEENGTYYVVTEYVRGADLKEYIRRNAPFPAKTAVDVAIAICDVLDFAHARGFIHGDLRPGNILVSPEGYIKLADFWVSSAVASSQSVRTNAMMRSVHYMSPEVAEGEPPLPASDIYSLGVLLFELLTGSVPFDGETPIAIALKHAQSPIPSVRALNPAVPKNLEAVVTRALQKNCENRFRSAKAMRDELRSVRSALTLSKPVTWPEPKKARTPEPSAEPQPDSEEDEAIDEVEPALLSTLRRILLVLLGIIALAVIAMIIVVFRKPGDVRVPQLVGKRLDQAHAIAEKAGIQLFVRAEEYNEEYPDRVIYYTNPAPGRVVKAGKVVDVWVSKGSRFATTPNVVNLSLDEAKKRIMDAGLYVGEVSQEYSATVPAGNIIRQTPQPGTKQERNQPVSIVFSLGPEPSELPMVPEGYDQTDQSEQTQQVEPLRSFNVKFTVPPGKKNVKVQIMVEDAYGESIAYSDIASPGDRIEQTVEGAGDKVTIRIFIDDKLVREERKWR